MPSSRLARLALTAALANLGVVLTPAAAVASPTTAPARVLIVGDSVTHGSAGDFTWRYFAWQQLGGGAVDFVGSHHGTYAGPGSLWSGGYADPAFDQDHAARWGRAMFQLADGRDSLDTPPVDELMASTHPDVVVLALGVNDLTSTGGDVEALRADTVDVVDQVRAADPSVDLVLGRVPQTWVSGAAQWNSALPALAEDLSTDTSQVAVAAAAGWTPADTTDGLHPSTAGQQKLAGPFAEVLGSLVGVPVTPMPPIPAAAVPAPTSTPVPVSTPARGVAEAPAVATLPVAGAPRRVKAREHGHRTSVTWRAGADAERYVVRCGRAGRVVAGLRASLRADASSCRVRATNGSGASAWVRVTVQVREG